MKAVFAGSTHTCPANTAAIRRRSCMIPTAFALALVSVTAAVSGSLPSHNARGETWLADRLEHVVTGSAAYGHLQRLQQAADGNGGTRATGTGGFRASAEYVAEQLEHAGYR